MRTAVLIRTCVRAAGAAALLAALTATCGDGSTAPSEVEVAALSIVDAPASILVDDAVEVCARTEDHGGRFVAARVSWSSSAEGIARTEPTTRDGCVLLRGVAEGDATLTASAGRHRATHPVTVEGRPVATVTIAPATASVAVGGMVTLGAEPRDDRGRVVKNRPVTWRSANAATATVSSAGVVTGVAPGGTTITAEVDGVQASAEVTVTPEQVARVAVVPEEVSLLVGQRVRLDARAFDASGEPLAGRAATWSSDEAAVASVDADGWVTAHASGTATITASVEGVQGTAAVTVSVVPVASVQVSPTASALQVGATTTLTATAKDSSGNVLEGRTVSWSTSASGVATVAGDGTVTAVAVGTAAITATIEGKSATAQVTVVPVPVVSVTVEPAAVALDVGGTATLAAAPRDAKGNVLGGRAIAWSTSAPGVATVSSSGRVTAVGPGTATITATVEGVQGTATVTVHAPPVDDTVRVITFGDSNTDIGWSGRDPTPVAASYVSNDSRRLAPTAAHHPTQLAAKIVARWRAVEGAPIVAVNHGIAGTTTTGGAGGQPERHWRTQAPNARTVVNQVTRFEGEVLGLGYPWSGGEPANEYYPGGPIRRVNAFRPTDLTFAYVSLGTNDAGSSVPASRALANLEWMVDRWIADGHRADYFIVTTLAPGSGATFDPQVLRAVNLGIRDLAQRRGLGLVDIAAHTSNDDGLTWRDPSLHLEGDEIHYAESVRDWIAQQVVAWMRARVPAP